MRVRDWFMLLASMAITAASGSVHAQMVDAGGKRIDAFMVDEPPVLDGVLDDDAWAFATVITDVHQVTPEEFAAPSEDSTFYVVYTLSLIHISEPTRQ